MACMSVRCIKWPIKLTITNNLTDETITHETFVKKRGVLFGVLNNLQDSCEEFSFTYDIDNNGLCLESVNGVKGSEKDHTYWQILTKTAEGEIPLDTGIGGYIPMENEHIILRFTKQCTNPCSTDQSLGEKNWGDSITCPPCAKSESEKLAIKLTVTNDLTDETITHKTFVKKGGVLFGALYNLQELCKGFSFTYDIDKSFGLYLESVNEVKGSKKDHTYWQLLKETAEDEETLDTGIGCYKLKENDHIILRFTSWDSDSCSSDESTEGKSSEDSVTCIFCA